MPKTKSDDYCSLCPQHVTEIVFQGAAPFESLVEALLDRMIESPHQDRARSKERAR